MAIPFERLFIGLWPDESVRSALAAEQQRWTWPARAALVRADKMHATLHFLGNVESRRVEALVRALDVASPPFELELDRATVWPGGIAVLEADAPPALAGLHVAVGDVLAGLGFELESRPYRPHVTLSRRAQGALPPPQRAPLRWPVYGHVLVRSAGSDYTVLARYPRTSAITVAPKSARSR